MASAELTEHCMGLHRRVIDLTKQCIRLHQTASALHRLCIEQLLVNSRLGEYPIWARSNIMVRSFSPSLIPVPRTLGVCTSSRVIRTQNLIGLGVAISHHKSDAAPMQSNTVFTCELLANCCMVNVPYCCVGLPLLSPGSLMHETFAPGHQGL